MMHPLQLGVALVIFRILEIRLKSDLADLVSQATGALHFEIIRFKNVCVYWCVCVCVCVWC